MEPLVVQMVFVEAIANVMTGVVVIIYVKKVI